MASLFSKKVAIVTGASSGFGEAIAMMFASRGARVTLCGRDQDRLKVVLDNVVKVSGGFQDKFLSVQGDINDQGVRKGIVGQTVEKFGRMDILVACAGTVYANQSVFTATEESYNGIMDTNLKSVFFLIQQAVPYLEKSKGNIVNISSFLSTVADPEVAIYSLSKVALDHLTRCLAVGLGPKGIRVNTVNPAIIPTRILRNYGDDIGKLNTEFGNTELCKQALKGRSGRVEDVAEAVSFLASEAAEFITGENIRVDGGRCFSGPIDWATLREKL